MKHAQIRAKLVAYMDNELPEKARMEISAHIGACPECMAELENLRAADSELKNSPDTAVPDGFVVRIKERIHPGSACKKAFNLGRLIPVPLALAVVVLVSSALFAAVPFVYASGGGIARDMAIKTVAACYGGSVFTPAAFAKFCCTACENMCECSGSCKEMKCKNMGGMENGNKE